MTKEVAMTNNTVILANKDVQGIGMPGLEYMPTSFIPVPRIKLVQSNTQDILLPDGETEAPKGTFYYENTQETQKELHIAVLSAKPMTFTGPSLDDSTKTVTNRTIGIIFYDLLTKDVMTLRFTPGSFGNWRALIGQAVAAHKNGDMPAFFSREIIVTTEQVRDGSRSWYVLRFRIGEELTEDDFASSFR